MNRNSQLENVIQRKRKGESDKRVTFLLRIHDDDGSTIFFVFFVASYISVEQNVHFPSCSYKMHTNLQKSFLSNRYPKKKNKINHAKLNIKGNYGNVLSFQRLHGILKVNKRNNFKTTFKGLLFNEEIKLTIKILKCE